MTDATKPGDDLEIDFQEYYTTDEAALQVLCWMHGVKRRKYIPKATDGVPVDQYPFLDTLRDSENPLLQHYVELQVADRFGADSNASNDVIQQHHDERQVFGEMQTLHDAYSAMIRREAIADKSALIFVDTADGLCVSRQSLHLWICETFGVKPSGYFAPLLKISHTRTELPPNELAQKEVDTTDSQLPCNEPDMNELGERKTENVLITLAFLAEAFSVSQKIYKHGGKPNATKIAEHVRTLADEADPCGSLSGLDVQTIRKLISAAMKAKERAILRIG